ncbi:peptidase inhibitor family I36 protein [Endozoicomonas arenosclerae]|uniref:peptidase inhibitor family I36 protein n=1 Tax=Endozoicomonas arenosclerae TaxID=1633495 RepID=UPI00078213FE|nr:peptidase inhibitor family I36 protein [Endozoicomonas arenosclerae]
MKIKTLGCCLLLALGSQAASAQDNKVCFYEHPEYQGSEWCYGQGDVGWIGSSPNDRISSIRLYGDAYVTIYEHGSYGGKKTVVMANTYKMDDLDDAISSFKVRSRESGNFACLFEHPGFRGTPVCLEEGQSASDLNHFALGRNKASSMIVAGKSNVEVFEYPEFNKGKKYKTLTRSTSNLEKRPGDWLEDNIDSFKVSARSASAEELALDINESLGYRAPVRQTTVLASHNAFNSTAYFSAQLIPGPNHRRAMIEQLQLGVRFFELDVRAGSNYLRVCHSTDCGQKETTMRRMLAEVDSWLKGADDNDVVFFFLQDDIKGDNKGYQQLQKDIEWMGDSVYTISSCQTVPMDLTFEQVRQSGKRVFFYKSGGSTGCGTIPGVMLGSGFEKNIGVASIDVNRDYTDADRFLRSQECHNHFCHDVVSADEARVGIENGVNAFGLDMLEESDLDKSSGRLNKQLWAVGPEDTYNAFAHGRIAVFKSTGNRFMKLAWNQDLPYACRLSNGSWQISSGSGQVQQGASVCPSEFPGSTFDVPLNAAEAKQLRKVLGTHSTTHINFAVDSGAWKAGRWNDLGSR